MRKTSKRWLKNQVEQTVRNRALQEYMIPNTEDTHNSIVRPTVDANTFEIKPTIIQMV